MKSKIYRGLRVPANGNPFKPGLLRKLNALHKKSRVGKASPIVLLPSKTAVRHRPKRQNNAVRKIQRFLGRLPLKAIIGFDESFNGGVIFFIFWFTIYGVLLKLHHPYLAVFIFTVFGLVKFFHNVYADSKTQVSKGSGYTSYETEEDYDEMMSDEEEFDDDNMSDKNSESYDSNCGASRTRSYYDSDGMYIGYRDEQGWVHDDRGHNYMGRIDDDGSFYDSQGMYRGSVNDNGYLWEDSKGYTGYQDGDSFSSEGNYGVPEVYEEGGDGTAGAFKSLYDDELEDED